MVEVIRWPSDESLLTRLRRAGRARLVLVPAGVAPPLTVDPLEDWVRLPATEDDIEARRRVLDDRMRSGGSPTEPEVPELDESGLLRMGDRWVSLPPVELRLTLLLLERYRTVVSRDALARAGWPDGIPGRNVLDVHVVRLRRRIAPLGLAIRTVRSRGYLLEEAATGSVTAASS